VSGSAPLVVVSAGTYHLPFDRLGEWIGRWHARNRDVRIVFQHGPSRPVPGAENFGILAYEDLLDLCRRADAVVLQGGAGGVMDMRSLGIVPIVVPRVPGAGEVVDDHQLVFSEEMAKLGLLHRATTYEELTAALSAALSGATLTAARKVSTHAMDHIRAQLSTPPRPVPWTTRSARLMSATAGEVRRRLTRSGR